MKRVILRQHDANWRCRIEAGVTPLPNTPGAKPLKRGDFLRPTGAREAPGTNWLKLEIHPDLRWLLPDPIGNAFKSRRGAGEAGFCGAALLRRGVIRCVAQAGWKRSPRGG